MNISNNIKFSLFGVVASLGIFTSCAELDPDVTKFNPPVGAFETLEDLSSGVAGTYAALNDASRKTTYYVEAWAGDDITTGGTTNPDGNPIDNNKQDFREFDQRVVTSGNSRLTDHWNDNYEVIRNATSSINRSEGLEVLLPTAVDEINALRGEALFLRALAYHKLLRMHNQVPIIEDLAPEPTDIVFSSRTEVLEYIENDLLEAIALLPNVNTGPFGETVEIGHPRAGKGSAKGILARVYMDWAGYPTLDADKYISAARLAKEVIDESADYNLELIPDPADLWILANRFNNESVFTLAFANRDTQDNFLENQKYGAVGYSQVDNGWEETFAEVRFFEEFPEGPRKEATYLTNVNFVSRYRGRQQNPIFRKITGPVIGTGRRATRELGTNQFKSDRNDFIMRYPEVLLIYAEASGRSGNVTSEAWDALNEVRRRAYEPGTPDVGPADGSIEDLAFTERKWEFAGEYQRWNDLVRTQSVEEALLNRDPQTFDTVANRFVVEANPIINPGSTLPVSIENYFHPIPSVIAAANPNLQQ